MKKYKSIKTFKSIEIFKKKLQTDLCWEDYFKIDGKLFKIYEYGSLGNCDYVYFYNKRSDTMIYIEYVCPSSHYENGVKIQGKTYRFISLEVIEDPDLWRTDTL